MAIWRTLKWLSNPRTGARVPYRNLDWTPILRTKWEIRSALRHKYGRYSKSLPYLPFTQPQYPGPYPFSLKRSTAKRARDAFAISKVVHPGSMPFRVSINPMAKALRSRSNFLSLGDGRAYHPEGKSRPYFVTERSASDLVVPPYRAPTKREFDREEEVIRRSIEKAKRKINWKKSTGTVPVSELAFRIPSKVVICAKRRLRREILASMGVLGRLVARPHYTLASRIGC